jgi:hypothetical protein
MKRHRRLSSFRAIAAAGIVHSLLVATSGCNLDERAQEFVQTTLDSVVSTATDTFLLTPINNFISAQIDQALDQFAPDQG